jgi:PAS domain S-box-containing protein
MTDEPPSTTAPIPSSLLATLLEHTPVVVFAVDAHGRFAAVAGSGLAPTELEAGALVGQSAVEVFGDLQFHCDDGETMTVPDVLQRVEAGETYSGTTPVAGRVFHSHLLPLLQEDETVWIVGVAVDCTQRQTAQLELQRSRQKLTRTLDSLAAAVLVVGPEHRGVAEVCNAAVERIFGYAPEELIGQTTEKLHVDRATYERFAREGEPKLEANGRFETELEMRRKDGSTFDAHVLVSSLDQNEGWRGGVVSVIHDVTDRQRIERRLRTSEERFRRAFEEAPVGAVLLAPDLSIRRANTVFQQLSGYSAAELERMDAVALTFPEDVDPTVTERVLNEGSVRGLIRRYRRKSGDMFWGRVSAGAIRTPNGDASEVLAMVEDITEQVRAAEEREQLLTEVRALSQQLTEAEQKERKALAQELHDTVGQDLAALSLNLAMVRDHLAQGTTEAADALLSDSMRVLEGVGERVRDVMAELRPPMLDDYGLAATLRWIGERFAGRSGLSVRVVGEEPAPRLSPVTETTLLRVAQEALTNVDKHAEASSVTVTLESSAELVRVTVADDGRGFAASDRPTPSDGGGWGIAGMRERTEALGGTFRIETEPGNGCRVIAEVPRS